MMDDHTCDTIFDGRLSLRQPRSGYRFSVDSLILAASVADSGADSLLDVGCGVGVIGIAAAHLVPSAHVTCVEVQADLAQLARDNVEANGLARRVAVIESDVRELVRGDVRPAEIAVMNPPYYPLGAGRLNPSGQRAAARHEVFGTLASLLRASAGLLVRDGKIRLVYPAEELAYLMGAIQEADLKTTWLRAVHSFADGPAKFVLVDARQSGRREMQIARDMVIFEAPGRYTRELAGILGGIRED